MTSDPTSLRYVSTYRVPHISCPQPADGSVKVWRYLDLARFITVLRSSNLPLIRLDKLGDAHEGAITRGAYEAWTSDQWVTGPEFKRLIGRCRLHTHVSSWRAGTDESEAMWRLYCGDEDGVAIQTTYERLDASLPPDIFLGEITYIDYDADSRPPSDGDADQNALTLMMQKRKAFACEQEVRVLSWQPALTEGVYEKTGKEPDPPVVQPTRWNRDEAVEAVYVNPYAPEWYRDVVAAVIERLAPALVDRLLWSSMKGEPPDWETRDKARENGTSSLDGRSTRPVPAAPPPSAATKEA